MSLIVTSISEKKRGFFKCFSDCWRFLWFVHLSRSTHIIQNVQREDLYILRHFKVGWYIHLFKETCQDYGMEVGVGWVAVCVYHIHYLKSPNNGLGK